MLISLDFSVRDLIDLLSQRLIHLYYSVGDRSSIETFNVG